MYKGGKEQIVQARYEFNNDAIKNLFSTWNKNEGWLQKSNFFIFFDLQIGSIPKAFNKCKSNPIMK